MICARTIWLIYLGTLLLSTSLTACGDDGAGTGDGGCQGNDCVDLVDRGRDMPDVGDDPSNDGADDEGDLAGGEEPVTEPLCEALTERVCFDETSYRVCNSAGTGFNSPVACGQFQSCVQGRCEDPESCIPGPIGCLDDDTVEVCLDNRFQTEGVDCEDDLVCYEGRCIAEACRPDQKSYIGCEFWAVDLDNHIAAAGRQAVITVSNANDSEVSVQLVNQESFVTFRDTVAPHEIEIYGLPLIGVDNTELSRASYHVETSLPVTVHQFNPRNNSAAVYTNDASLLLPATAIGRDYVVLGWPTQVSGGDDDGGGATLHSYATIVGTLDDTDVTIDTPVTIAAGDGFERLEAETQRTVTLNAGDVLNLSPVAANGADLSGMHISATQNVVVFAGSECANVPLGTPYCDHLEQQLMPTNTWGREHVAAKFEPRGLEDDLWRIISASDGNILTTQPVIDGIDGATLDRGGVLELVYDGSFWLVATAPVAVGQFMVGAEYSLEGRPQCQRVEQGDCAIPASELCFDGASAIGDPAFLLNVPVNQFRNDYFVLTPLDYEQDFLTIVFSDGAEIELDGETVETGQAQSVGDTDYRVLRLPVQPGQHRVVSSTPVGLSAYGYDCDVSYAYPGGLNLIEAN